MRLRNDCNTIVREAIAQVRPDAAVARALAGKEFGSGKLILVAVGKAAWSMAHAAWESLDRKPDGGIVITKHGHSEGPIGNLEVWEAGHPVPDDDTFAATSGDSLETQKSNDTAAYTSGSGQSGIQVDLPSASEDAAQENGASVTVGPSNQADLPTVHVSAADIGDLLDGREPAETENSGTLRYLLTRQEYDDLVAELADRGVSLEEPDADSQQLWLEVTEE